MSAQCLVLLHRPGWGDPPSIGGVADLDVGVGDGLPDMLGVVDLSVG